MAYPLDQLADTAASVSAPANTDDVATIGSGNVFADLGFENPAEERLKADLVIGITDEIARRKLSQAEAGRIMGLSQPDVSKMLRGRIGGFSLERLLSFTLALGNDVEITVKRAVPATRGLVKLHILEGA